MDQSVYYLAYLDLSASEQRLIERHSQFHAFLLSKLHICKSMQYQPHTFYNNHTVPGAKYPS